jgi:hypothetical protein
LVKVVAVGTASGWVAGVVGAGGGWVAGSGWVVVGCGLAWVMVEAVAVAGRPP